MQSIEHFMIMQWDICNAGVRKGFIIDRQFRPYANALMQHVSPMPLLVRTHVIFTAGPIPSSP